MVPDPWLADPPGIQFHCHNRGYGSFADFLATLSRRRRKTIGRERRQVAALGIWIGTLSADELAAEVLEAFHPLYQATVDRHAGQADFSRNFFRRLGT